MISLSLFLSLYEEQTTRFIQTKPVATGNGRHLQQLLGKFQFKLLSCTEIKNDKQNEQLDSCVGSIMMRDHLLSRLVKRCGR